jgi:plasmid segregation protein ParM
MEKKVIVGLDIGYSNLKIAVETNGSERCIVLPAGAAPADRFGTRFDGSLNEEYINVLVNDESYIAGVSPDKAAMHTRELHDEYANSNSYKALFHAALLLVEEDEIDILVTGLPVKQFNEEKRKTALENMMTGKHQVTPIRSVVVKKTIVIPQPIGGFLDYVNSENVDIDDSRILVIDPGFFSVDWVVIRDGNLQKQSSGTSLTASSVILEQCAISMAADYGAKVSIEVLENAFRKDKKTIKILGKQVDFVSYLNNAIKAVVPSVLTSMKQAIRNEYGEPDEILLVGGGAQFFEQTVKTVFDRVNVKIPNDAICSNARGFLVLAKAKS